jgi:hypothetical protein
MQNTNADHDKIESDETSKVEQLENRVEELESKLNNEMTRRALIAAGGVAGGGVLGTLFGCQRASAQTDPLVLRNVDQLGTSSNPVQDLYVENLTNYSSSETFDDLTVNNRIDAGSASVEMLSFNDFILQFETVDNKGLRIDARGNDNDARLSFLDSIGRRPYLEARDGELYAVDDDGNETQLT